MQTPNMPTHTLWKTLVQVYQFFYDKVFSPYLCLRCVPRYEVLSGLLSSSCPCRIKEQIFVSAFLPSLFWGSAPFWVKSQCSLHHSRLWFYSEQPFYIYCCHHFTSSFPFLFHFSFCLVPAGECRLSMTFLVILWYTMCFEFKKVSHFLQLGEL